MGSCGWLNINRAPGETRAPQSKLSVQSVSFLVTNPGGV